MKKLLIIITIAMSGCYESRTTSPEATDTEALLTEPRGTVEHEQHSRELSLGQAYDSISRDFHPFTCIESDNFTQFLGNSGSEITFSSFTNSQEVKEQLSGTLALDINTSSFSVGAGGIIDESLVDSGLTSVKSFIAKVTPRKKVLLSDSDGNFSITDTCNEVKMNQNLGELIGNEYISSISYGAMVVVTIKTTFASRSDKSKLSGYINIGASGLIDASAAGSIMRNNSEGSLKVELVAKQIGGQADRLGGVLSEEVASCDISNLTECFESFNNISTYARDLGNQLNSVDDYNIIAYETTPYIESGIYELHDSTYKTNPTKELIIAEIMSEIINQEEVFTTASSLINSNSPIYDRSWLQQQKNLVQDNISSLKSTYNYCMDSSLSDCESRQSTVFSSLNEIPWYI